MLKGKKVLLRNVEREDLNTMLSYENDILQRGQWVGLNLTASNSMEKRFEKDGYWRNDTGALLIIDKEDNQIAGVVGFFVSISYFEGYEIGFKIYDPNRRNKGLMTEALSLFSSYIFYIKQIERLQALSTVGNNAARKVLEKCNFIHEGTLRRAIFHGGILHDLDIFSLLREEAPKFTTFNMKESL